MIQDLCQNFNILACHSPVLMQKAAVHLCRPLRKLVLGIDLYRVRKDPVRKIQTAVRMRPPAKLLIDPLLLKFIKIRTAVVQFHIGIHFFHSLFIQEHHSAPGFFLFLLLLFRKTGKLILHLP